MGLSDTERREQTYHACLQLSKLGQKLKDTKQPYSEDKDADHLIMLLEKVWTCLLNGNHNSTHWLLGSSATQQITDSDSPWACAISHHCYNARNQNNIMNIYDRAFDPFEHYLSIQGLLKQEHDCGTFYESVYEIYAWTEQLVYSLRRYDDEFLGVYAELSNLISRIQGACYAIFNTHNVYAKAYLAHEIFVELYKNQVYSDLAKFQHWHHDSNHIMDSRDVSLQNIMDWHRKLYRKDSNLSTVEMICMHLEIVGRKFHHEHMYKVLEKRLKADGVTDDDLKPVREAFEKCVEADKINSKEDSEVYREGKEWGHINSIHGYIEDKSEEKIMEARLKEEKDYKENEERVEELEEKEREEMKARFELPSPPKPVIKAKKIVKKHTKKKAKKIP